MCGLLAGLFSADGTRAACWVAEDHALLLAEGEQRPQRDQEAGPACPVQVVQDGLDVVAGDLPQVVVTL